MIVITEKNLLVIKDKQISIYKQNIESRESIADNQI